MHKQQLPQIFELCDRVIGRACRLQTFDPGNSDADVGTLDHRNVIGAIANR